jgi:hypothetical protein
LNPDGISELVERLPTGTPAMPKIGFWASSVVLYRMSSLLGTGDRIVGFCRQESSCAVKLRESSWSCTGGLLVLVLILMLLINIVPCIIVPTGERMLSARSLTNQDHS